MLDDELVVIQVRIRGMGAIAGALFLAAPIFDAECAICGSIASGSPRPAYSAALDNPERRTGLDYSLDYSRVRKRT